MPHSFEKLSAIAIILFFTMLSLGGFFYWILTDIISPFVK
ncbi:MAG: hypothetical protein RIQ33_453 [Bacteroidota bacterium]|jgi:hypothetical protein